MKTGADSTAAVSVRELTKDFPVKIRGVRLRAVDSLSLDVRSGEVFGLLGPNGSGKSTTIKMILGLLRPTRGSCSIFGKPSDEVRSRLQVGYLPEAPYFHRFLTGRELVRFYGRMCGMSAEEVELRAAAVLSEVGLGHAANRRIETYSKGMLQRVGLAQALVHNPRLVILDEPTAGVDPVGAEDIARMIRRLKDEGRTVIVCSHLLAQVEDLCDRVAILKKGRLVALGAVDELSSEDSRYVLSVDGFRPEMEREIQAWLEEHGCSLVGVARARRPLEQVFLDHVRSAEDADGAAASEGIR